MLPEKRKPTRQPFNSRKESKGKNRPALKVAGGGSDTVPELIATEIKERPEVVRDPCDRKTSTLIGRRLSVAVEAKTERSPVGVAGDAVAQVLERP